MPKSKWVLDIRHKLGLIRKDTYSWYAVKLGNPNFSVKLEEVYHHGKWKTKEEAYSDWVEFAKINGIDSWAIV